MKNRTSGFTLVELMVVVLLVGLVALVSTQIPLFSLSSWRKGTERLRMQRDANVAMIRIQRKLRPASFFDISTSAQTLVIDGERFFLEGDTLWYDNTGGVEEPEPVIEGYVDADFFVTPNNETRTINVTLTLVKGSGQTTLTTTVKPRN